MKRISKEKFLAGKWEEAASAIRIKDGEFYWLGDIEEWPDAPEFSNEGLRIAMPYKAELLLNRDYIMFRGIFDATASEDYDRTPMTYIFETEEEVTKYENVYDCLLQLVEPHTRNGESDEDDYDIFIMSSEEIIHFCDALRDGDYIIINEAKETETLIKEVEKLNLQTPKKVMKYEIKMYDSDTLLLDTIFAAEEYLEYATKHNFDVCFTETGSQNAIKVLMMFQKEGYKISLVEEKRTAPGGIELEPDVVIFFRREEAAKEKEITKDDDGAKEIIVFKSSSGEKVGEMRVSEYYSYNPNTYFNDIYTPKVKISLKGIVGGNDKIAMAEEVRKLVKSFYI